MFFTNDSLYFPYNIFVESTSYCLAVMHQNKSDVIICLENYHNCHYEIIFSILRSVSTLFLLGTFLVYAILPELRNTHGFMLRRYCASISAAKILNIIGQLIIKRNLAHFICVTIAFLKYFCFLASYFWLTVMSFNMWWTFKKLQSLQQNVIQRKKKKLVIYSIYAWGFPFILTIVCSILNFVPGVPENLQPKLYCFFLNRKALMLYFYVPKIICIISSICLSICAALKIRHYEKDTVRCLKDSESRRYNEDKKWFNLYLKLFIMTFIVMGIKCFMELGLFLYKAIHQDKYYKYTNISRYITYSMDIVLNLGIFIIFVCKKTIKRLLLKRFGCQKCHLLPKIDTKWTQHLRAPAPSRGIPMQKEISFYRQTNFDAIHSDVTEF